MIAVRRGLIAIGLFVCGMSALAIPDESPYQAIIERNIFGLNPPPPPQTNNSAADEAPLNIKFTGITTLGDEKKAWFMVQSKDPKEPPTYLSLPEGERSGPVEVREILEGSGEVRVITGGKEMLLSFKDHGNKAHYVAIAGASPAPAGPGRIPPPPRSAVNPPGVRGANPAIPSPSSRSNNRSSGLMAIPTRQLRTSQQQPAPPQNNMSTEEALLIHEATRIKNMPKVQAGMLPPLPSIMDAPAPGAGQGAVDGAPPGLPAFPVLPGQ